MKIKKKEYISISTNVASRFVWFNSMREMAYIYKKAQLCKAINYRDNLMSIVFMLTTHYFLISTKIYNIVLANNADI